MNTPTSPARIALVTGARGGIGSEVVARLRASGHRVAAVGRNAETLAGVPADAHITADTTTPEGAVLPWQRARNSWAPPRRCWRTAWAAR